MGFFTPKLSHIQKEILQNKMKQLHECDKLVHTTVKPDVFFGRLNFMLDLLLDLKSYEKYKIFVDATPTENYQLVLTKLEDNVNEFLDRAIADNQKNIAALKTEKGKKSKELKFAESLVSAFDCANSFWSGDGTMPHYVGSLFTENNYKRVKKLFDASSQ